MSGSGISWAICKSALHSRQITMPAPHHSSFKFTYSVKYLLAISAVVLLKCYWLVHWQAATLAATCSGIGVEVDGLSLGHVEELRVEVKKPHQLLVAIHPRQLADERVHRRQLDLRYDTIRYDTRCYFNVRSKADTSQLNLPQGTNN